MKSGKLFSSILIFVFLTILTQIGGIVYLISNLLSRLCGAWIENKYLKNLFRLVFFLLLYSLSSFIIVPKIAEPFGRVPLPFKAQNHLKPLTTWTCLLNRHYVKSDLRLTAFEVAIEMNNRFPGTIVNYLDANFPFFDKFPLFPHLSHNDGEKLDLSFSYKNTRSGTSTNDCPSFIGYGICEEPRNNEKNTAEMCRKKGYWQYSWLTKIVPQHQKQNFKFDDEKTRILINLLAYSKAIGKIFIEPHLQSRLNITSNKIRFHGCQAVRHDDHIHIQLK